MAEWHFRSMKFSSHFNNPLTSQHWKSNHWKLLYFPYLFPTDNPTMKYFGKLTHGHIPPSFKLVLLDLLAPGKHNLCEFLSHSSESGISSINEQPLLLLVPSLIHTWTAMTITSILFICLAVSCSCLVHPLIKIFKNLAPSTSNLLQPTWHYVALTN